MNELDFLLNDKNKPKQEKEETSTLSMQDEVEKKMKEFLGKQPKIGIWSYPAYVLLQYLYSTVPGFRVSKTAREALELGLKQLYPDLFEKAQRVCNLIDGSNKNGDDNKFS